MKNKELNQNDPNMFPLNLDRLKIYASRWVSALPDVKIEKISLYRYSSNLVKITTKPVSLKYCVVFDIKNEVLPLYPHNVASIEEILQIKIYPEYPDTTNDDHTSYMALLNQSIYGYLECFHTIYDEFSYSFLMDAGFIDVYPHKPDEHFKNEWIFLTGCLAKGNTSIMFQEPHWILFNATDMEKMSLSEQGLPESGTIQQTIVTSKQVKPTNLFKRNGDFWQIRYEGNEGNPIKHVEGLFYISHLLKKPGSSVSCKELYQSISGRTPEKIMYGSVAINEAQNIGFSKQVINEDDARRSYANKYMRLKNDLEKAESDTERQEIEIEMNTLLPYLKKRSFVEPNDKKAQINLKKRLDVAYKTISNANMKDLTKYLQDNIKPNGALGLRYIGSLTWEIIE